MRRQVADLMIEWFIAAVVVSVTISEVLRWLLG